MVFLRFHVLYLVRVTYYPYTAHVRRSVYSRVKRIHAMTVKIYIKGCNVMSVCVCVCVCVFVCRIRMGQSDSGQVSVHVLLFSPDIIILLTPHTHILFF